MELIMPTLSGLSYQERRAKLKAREKKILALGIDPRSSKFLKLLYRHNY